ncbi:hypothetical protein SO802_002534 [Lithocarpus litseifolius]|uniref:Uncharacterized protein n=1 Tax=Lithocarpus litseifolius TaxID=425828 RepID=A0AAW2DXI3_9ROSI
MESAKLRAQIRAAAAHKKEEGKGKKGVSSSLPKVIVKGAPKRKGDRTKDGVSKKQTVTPREHPTKPPSPKHGARKGVRPGEAGVHPRGKDTDPCVNQSMGELGDSGIFDLARAMVHMKAMQVKGVKSEELLACQQKHIKNMTDRMDQYKDACRTLNGEVNELERKLEEGSRQLEKEWEAKVETAKADAVTEFKTSQTFIDSCAEYYGDGFEDFLKQVKSLYPHLDLSKVSIDDPLPSTPMGKIVLVDDDSLSESGIHPKDDGFVLAQPAQDKFVAPIIPSADPPSFEGFPVDVIQDPPKDDEVVPDAPAL